jgi:vanillate O-demethylase monooxygenase subunit
VRRYQVHEQHGWIWVWMGEPAHGDIADIPLTPWLDDPAWRYVPGYLHYPVQHLLIADNLLDFSHLPYVHPTTLGGTEAYAKVLPTIERLPRGIRVTRWLRDQPAAPYVTKIKAWSGNVDRWNIYDFLVPGILIMDSGSAPTDTGAPQGTRVDACEFRGCQAITPETENSTHYFFSQPHNFGFDQPGLTEAIHQNIVDAFFEDQALIKAQRDNLARAPEFSMLPMAIDAALVQYRSIFDRLLAAQAMI